MPPESTPPKIVLHHSPGSDDWLVTLDCGTKIKLRTLELRSYTRFRWAALFQAGRFFSPMSRNDWFAVLGDALESLRQRRRK
jgi:hypothetical protein